MLLMVGEMTGNLSLLAPAMIAVALATALVGDETIYHSQLPDRSSAPAHRVRLSFPLLSSLRVRDAMTLLTPNGSAAPTEGMLLLSPDATLDDALEQISEAHASEAAVIEREHLVGRVTTRDIVATYKLALARGVRRTRRLGAESTLLEAHLVEGSSLAGKSLQEIMFPADALVVSITRATSTIFPRGSTVLEEGDRLLLVTDPHRTGEVRTFVELPSTREGVASPVPDR